MILFKNKAKFSQDIKNKKYTSADASKNVIPSNIDIKNNSIHIAQGLTPSTKPIKAVTSNIDTLVASFLPIIGISISLVSYLESPLLVSVFFTTPKYCPTLSS